jgi:hypothetical protein
MLSLKLITFLLLFAPRVDVTARMTHFCDVKFLYKAG